MQTAQTPKAAGTDQRGFFAMIRALSDAAADLARNTAQMAASEARIVVRRIALRISVVLAGLFVASMGLLLVLFGAALFLARALQIDDAPAFAIVGGVTLIAGALFAYLASRRLDDPDLSFQATLAELKADLDAMRAARDAAEETP